MKGYLKIIRQCLFKRCINLKKVIIPESVKLIEPHAFSECRKLESVRLPNLTGQDYISGEVVVDISNKEALAKALAAFQ
ncbi:leucine-rich repeat protein [Eubacterium callanderi]|uniref:leucine-rich repeat protein n=1 Tax=Eubacterium callanderi TaxID=53442 RepID=UPI0034A320AC